MNCDLLRSRLLASPHPERPPADLRAHLTACASCRQWQRRLVRLERQIPRLPVPPSRTKDEVVRRILTAPRRTPATLERGLQKLSLATALAAALALFAVGL